MPFALYAPGTRKNNRFWIAHVNVDGRRVELSTKTTSKNAAKQFAQQVERQMLAQGPPKRGDVVSFAQAARLYAAFRGLDLDDPLAQRGQLRVEAGAINRLVALLGKQPVGELGHPDLVAAANQLFPTQSPATKNRWVIKPGAAILHYAAEQKFCGWERIKKFREKKAKTRAVSVDVAAALVAAAPDGPKRLLLVWLFRQGTRISDTLQLSWEENIKLAGQRVYMPIGKAQGEWAEFALHPEVFEMLAAIPAAARQGRLFPWATKSGVYRWLRPLARQLGVGFTPHMARHSVGTWLNETGAGLRTIMAALHHRDPQSSIRYQSADVEIVRAAIGGFAPLTRKAANG